MYRNIAAMIRTQFSATVKVFGSDNAEGYKQKNFLKFLAVNGVVPLYLYPNTSQQNGHAESKHRHILLK